MFGPEGPSLRFLMITTPPAAVSVGASVGSWIYHRLTEAGPVGPGADLGLGFVGLTFMLTSPVWYGWTLRLRSKPPS